MASPHSPQSQYQAGSDEAFGDQQLHPQHGEYRESDVTEVIPTKTGDEESTLFNNGKPLSAGTANDTGVDFDRFSDNVEEIINECAINPTSTAAHDLNPAEVTNGADFFRKPDITDSSNVNEGFQFGKPSHQQLRIITGRPTSISSLVPAAESVVEHAPPYDTPPATEIEDATASPSERQGDNHELTGNEPPFQHGISLPPPEVGEKKRSKKNSKSRHRQQLIDEAPIEVSSTTSTTGFLEVQVLGASTADDFPKETGRDVHHDLVEVEQNHDTHDHDLMQNGHTQRNISPHDQLQDDLDVRMLEPSYHAEESSATLAHGSQDVGDKHQTASPVADHQNAAQCYDVPPCNEGGGNGQPTNRWRSPEVPTRVQKKKQKSRKTTPGMQRQSDGSINWDLRDYADLLVFKANEREQARQAALTSELEALRMELQQTSESKAALQDSLDDVSTQKQNLAATTSQQQEKINKYEGKFKNLKTFVDGVGKDLHALRKDANTLRQRGDDIMIEAEKLERNQVAARDDVRDRIEECSNIKKQAFDLAREKDEELIRTTLHRDQLQRNLSETVGLLSEQRDRCAKLETQLQESGKQLIQSLKTNHGAMLDKLHLIHAAVEDEEGKKDTSKMIEQLRSAAEAIRSPTDSTVQDLGTVKNLVESLDVRLNGNMEAAQAADASARGHWDETLKAIQAQLADREQLEQNHCGVVNSLQEQLKTCNDRISNEEAQKSAAQRQLHESQEKALTLQSKIAALQSKISPAENAQVQLNEARLEMEKTAGDLASAKVDLESKAEELKTRTLANTSLADQLKAVQERLQDLQSRREEPVAAQTLEKAVKEAEERARKELAVHFESFEIQLKTKSNNDLKKLNSEKVRLEKQIKPLQDELAICRRQIGAMRTKEPAAAEALKQELERTKEHSQSQKNELEALQSTISDLKSSSVDIKGLQEKLSTLSAQLNAEQSKAQHNSARNSELQEQLKQLEDTQQETQLAREQALEELATLRLNSESRVTALQKDLDDAKENADRAVAGLDTYKKSCDDTIDARQKQNDRKLQDLQKQLSETQAELESARHENKTFYEGVEQSWRDEQDTWSKKVAEATKKMADVKTQKAEAQASYEAIIQQLRIEMDEQRSSMKADNDKLQAQLKAAEELRTRSRIQVQSLKDGIPSSQQSAAKAPSGLTPSASASAQSIAPPTVPRKKINRNTSEVADVGPIPAPEEIRPDSRRTNSGHVQTTDKGPIVEESQFGLDTFAMDRAQSPAFGNTQSSFSSLIDELSGGIDRKQAQPASLTIPETQFDDGEDGLPTFAARNNSHRASQSILPSIPSSSHNLSRTDDSTGKHEQPIEDSVKTHDRRDWIEDRSESQPTYASGNLSQMQPWSQEENRKYIYQAPVPQPNSGSKRIEPPAELVKRRGSGAEFDSNRYKTPALDPRTSNDVVTLAPPSSRGSSPGFINDMQTSRRLHTYGTPGNRRIQDPRLVGRDDRAHVKRKASGQIIEGYEQERKKRVATKDNGMSNVNRPAQSQRPQSITELPNERTTRRSLQTHMQTLAGDTPRTTRAARKGNSHDKANARFAAELARPR